MTRAETIEIFTIDFREAIGIGRGLHLSEAQIERVVSIAKDSLDYLFNRIIAEDKCALCEEDLPAGCEYGIHDKCADVLREAMAEPVTRVLASS